MFPFNFQPEPVSRYKHSPEKQTATEFKFRGEIVDINRPENDPKNT